MYPLPQERLTKATPFAVTGIGFDGPVYTADFMGKKFYILLLNCGITRAIQFELCESLSLSDFMFAFRRFVDRRCMPRKVLSDNAKTFQAAAREVRHHYVEDSVKWIINTPRDP